MRTMETASLRILSPNTSMLRTGSTLRALKMAMVATGSTAEISEPKAKLQQVRRDTETEGERKNEFSSDEKILLQALTHGQG